MQPVYNLEVHGEHVYEVTRAGVLVHNNTPDCLKQDALRKKVADGLASADDLAEIAVIENRLLGDLSKLGAAPGPNGYSKAGHSLTKHNSLKRPGSSFPNPTGNAAQINQQAQKALDDILGNADRVIKQRGNILQVHLPSGTGVIYKWDGAQWVLSHFAENLY